MKQERFITSKLNRLGTVLAAAIALVIGGCGFHQASGEQALEVVEQFFTALKAHEFDRALTFYGDDFFTKETRQERRAYLAMLQDELGSLQSWSLRDEQVSTIFSGRRFMYKFVNQYADANATETLVLMQPVDDDKISIVAHQVESMALPRTSPENR